MRPPPEVRERIISLEDRLEGVLLRRSAVPAALILFVVLAFFMLGDEILDISWATTTFSWFLLFGAGALAGVTVNEITARRAIRTLEREIEEIRAPYYPDALTKESE